MIVFKAFFKSIKAYKGTILFYTILLIVFGGLNFQTSNISMLFVGSKPDIAIVNNDSKNLITDNLVKYLEKNNNIVKLKNNESKRNDALFYRDVNYIVYIPKDYGKKVLNNEKINLNIKKTPDYNASLAEMLLKRYLKIQMAYSKNKNKDEKQLVKNINTSLKTNTTVKTMSKLDTDNLSKMNLYFNFASYSIMSIIIFIICLVLSSFHEKSIVKRTTVSSMSYKKYNRLVLLAGIVYTIVIWILFIILGFILLGKTLLSVRGVIYGLNSLLFTMCSLTIALIISSLVNNKNILNGIVNVIALGSSFLSGAFIPARFLPKKVLEFSKILPTHWYINTNDYLSKLEVISKTSLKTIFNNMIIIVIFIGIFIIINNIITKYKRKVG